MRILESLHTTRIRRLKWPMDITRGAIITKRLNMLALIPDEESESYEVWWEHTKVIYQQWKAEESTRKIA